MCRISVRLVVSVALVGLIGFVSSVGLVRLFVLVCNVGIYALMQARACTVWGACAGTGLREAFELVGWMALLGLAGLVGWVALSRIGWIG